MSELAGLNDVNFTISCETSFMKTSLARNLNIVKANPSINLSGNACNSISIEIYYEGLSTIWKERIEKL